jgi:N-formylglutamate deformylase
MNTSNDAVIVRRAPAGERLPLVCDSPHSGTDYPADFRSALPMALLRQAEDTYIDTLWSAAPEVGATLVAARFPRSYIDPNRALEDLDPDLLDGPWPTPLQPGEKSRLGYGLVWRKLDPTHVIYDRRLSVAEVQQRIARCWQPYRDQLQQEIDSAIAAFGGVWHLHLHSMPNNAYARLGLDPNRPLADFVLGDRDGTTCEPGFVDVVERCLRGFGYSVVRNDPYKGVAVLAQIGQPALNQHSLQVEIRRPLYMDEATREPTAGFEPLRQHLTATLREVAAYVRSQIGDKNTERSGYAHGTPSRVEAQ